MTDYDLTVVPVVDDDERLLGVVTVDDVLELVLPRGWRRHFRCSGTTESAACEMAAELVQPK